MSEYFEEEEKKETEKEAGNISDTDPLVLEAKPSAELPEGKHEGIITKIEHRTEPYGYIDIYVKPKNKDFEVKAGFPDVITPKSSLGKLLERLGITFTIHEKVNLRKLIGKEVSFMSTNETKDQVTYVRVLRDTIKSLEV